MWIQRDLRERVRALAERFPAVLVTGARQTGKTSLLRALFPDRRFVSLDLPSLAEVAERRPSELLARQPPPVTIDEVQYAPALFRHLKIAIDADRSARGQFLLTGSQKFHLMRSVSDSLAGRCALLELHTLSAAEFRRHAQPAGEEWLGFLVRGGYPELSADPAIPPADFFASYAATYLERDVRNLIQVGNLRDFERFIRIAAARSGQLLNVSELARDVGVSASTGRQWISVLEASGILVLLQPYFNNFGKRLIKAPKIYFMDTGLLCYLLGISSVRAVLDSPFVEQVWESFICGQILRQVQLEPTAATVWYWRDAHGLEVDFLIDAGDRFELIECKWTEHPSADDIRSIAKLTPVLEAQRPVRARVACRTPSPFPLADSVDAVSGFEEDDWLRSASEPSDES